ncbi:dihydrofolate reductase [Alkalihalobacillus xiaoxiensis]|uniref:Dihydrofolate reductase n=1 Tax=Shouchella xiaoxiensis TaxID=766895 RepID=A0ABS2SZ94_9BACI|nr:dihydrofolate reductase [Shouchella xiaoxiensis]MBM7840541.1 dihydrofolate reductase [Shouchella xiaoxiensis]
MIYFVYARDRAYGIGKNNDLPWRLPADLKHFKKTTTGKTILMGRKTFDSMNAPLPNRRNLVMTRDKHFQADGAEVVYSVEEAMKKEEELYVIGGVEIFKLFWDSCDKQIVTVIDEEFAADTFIPPLDESEWELIEAVAGTMDEQNRYPHEYRTYQRKR